ncbi:histidine phosphatase family protein [Leuconostoc sp. MS02]|uniref:Histidine phosphatase family protein n=1 Tax=Leuconostoc aquikimchii TaxID=3236804 RepID=A0ABV3S391_9LACO
MKIYAVRHGQTIFNVLDKVQGWADTPLTSQGEQDGLAAGQRLKNVKFDVALSSDTSRAMHTAELMLSVNSHATPKLIYTPAWREFFFGSFEGGENKVMWGTAAKALGIDSETPDEVARQVDMTKIMDTIYAVDPQHLGENAAVFWQRMAQSLAKLQQDYDEHTTILLVTHGQLIWNLAQHYGHLKTADRPKNGAVAVFNIDKDGNVSVTNFNDVTTIF